MAKLFWMYNRCIMATFISLSVWIVSIIINAVLFAIVFAVNGSSDLFEGIGFVLLLSAIFSLPGIIVFWLVFLLQRRSNNLFGILLLTALCTSLLSVIIFFMHLSTSFGADRGFSIFLIPVLSAIIAVILHRPAIADVLIEQNNSTSFKSSESLET